MGPAGRAKPCSPVCLGGIDLRLFSLVPLTNCDISYPSCGVTI